MIFSQAQAEASQRALQFVMNTHMHAGSLLIWAVTGAGKTETIFSALAYALEQNKNVLIATPRKDVVLELTPRLQAAFPAENIISLHGDSQQKGESGRFVVATTHQTINFYRFFDLIIIDEVDAFPFHNNPMLHHAVLQACRPSGQFIYLTATPSSAMIKQTKTGEIECIRIPSRHHGYPLIEPTVKIEHRLYQSIQQKRIPLSVRRFMDHVVRTNRQGFIFVPSVEWIDALVNMLHTYCVPYEACRIEGTHARDPKRRDKVEAFRLKEITVLVTTTILERGVTLPSTDCLVYCADATLFDESALVQMAGRVGRSANDPIGTVFFIAETRSLAMVRAIKQIKDMNRLARKRGYLRENKSSIEDKRKRSFLHKMAKKIREWL